MSTLIIIIGILLIAFAVYSTIQKVRGKAKSSCCGTAEAVLLKKVEDTDESHYPFKYYVGIEGMSCSNCAARDKCETEGSFYRPRPFSFAYIVLFVLANSICCFVF